MSSLIQMQAVMETPYYKGEFSCPWEVSEFEPFSMLRLCGEMTYPEIGLVFAQLAAYNQVELLDNKQTVIEQILKAESLALPGGIQVICEGQSTISPSCCCGLETWREWIDFLRTGETPWLGHDPSPWVEMQDDVIHIWSDGGIEPASKAFSISVSRSHFEKTITLVERDLQAFLFCIESWAQEVGIAESSKLFQKFDECFSIRRFIKN